VKNANQVSALLGRLALLTVLFFAASEGLSEVAVAPAGATANRVFYPIKVGGKAVRLQLAVKRAEMEHGLMGRTDLKADEGMLFVYADPQRMSFWMRNTPTALDIGFFTADGILREVYPLYPFDETPVVSRHEALVYALEMKQGWFEFNGVKPGAQLDLEALAAALRARGESPRKSGVK
jgi:uncharacterized membrane protein (UPF0127 family)